MPAATGNGGPQKRPYLTLAYPTAQERRWLLFPLCPLW